MGRPNVGILYEPSNLLVYAGRDDHQLGFELQKSFIRHVHIKDQVRKPNGEYEATVAGRGILPWGEIVGWLGRAGYDHFLSFELAWTRDIDKREQELSEGSEDVRFVFITVDPERDNPQQLGLYLSNFDDDFLGLSGSDEELEKVFTDYGVYAAKKDIGSAAGYLVDHTARTYLIDKQGNWRLTYPFGMEPEKIISDVRHLLSE